MFVWLVVRNRERRVQYETRLRKRVWGKGDIIQRTFKTIGQWSQERVYLLFNLQAFSWANHLKHWILKMIVWWERKERR